MSGPGMNEGIYNNSRDGRRHYLLEPDNAERLRRLAKRVECYGGHELAPLYKDRGEEPLDEETAAMVAGMLRSKADILDAMRQTLRTHFGRHDIRELMKAIEWTDSGDYSPHRIKQAWDELGEQNE